MIVGAIKKTDLIRIATEFYGEVVQTHAFYHGPARQGNESCNQVDDDVEGGLGSWLMHMT